MVDFESLTLWTAIATWGLALGTVLLLYWQTHQTQRLNSANAVIMLRERFDSPRMRRARRQLAQEWLTDSVEDLASVEVLTFFELIGAQTKGGILREEMIWDAFGGWVTSYYWAMRNPKDRIGQLRESTHDPLVFFRFEWLNVRVQRMDRIQLGRDHMSEATAAQYCRELLVRESKLDVD